LVVEQIARVVGEPFVDEPFEQVVGDDSERELVVGKESKSVENQENRIEVEGVVEQTCQESLLDRDILKHNHQSGVDT